VSGDREFGGTVIKMGKFYVVNDLQQETISVKEGAGSAFSQVTSIPPGQQYVIHVNSQATYREIVLVLVPGKLQAKFSSDDCQECAGVKITGCDASKLLYEMIPKISRDVSGVTTDDNLSNAWQSILRFFGIGNILLSCIL